MSNAEFLQVKGVNDWPLFVFGYPIIAVSAVHLGNENSFSHLLTVPSYYTDLLFAFISTYIIGLYLCKLHSKAAALYSSSQNDKSKIGFLLLRGVLAPTLFAVGTEIIYLLILDFPLSESAILYLELPLIVIFLLLLNAVYLLLYAQKFSEVLKATVAANSKIKAAPTEALVVKKGNYLTQVAVHEAAYFILKDKLTFLVTTDNQSHLYDKPMKTLMETLPEQSFFRLNRQLIVNRKSIRTYKTTDTRRLEIELEPNLPEPVYLPKTKVSQFTDWLEQKQRPVQP